MSLHSSIRTVSSTVNCKYVLIIYCFKRKRSWNHRKTLLKCILKVGNHTSLSLIFNDAGVLPLTFFLIYRWLCHIQKTMQRWCIPWPTQILTRYYGKYGEARLMRGGSTAAFTGPNRKQKLFGHIYLVYNIVSYTSAIKIWLKFSRKSINWWDFFLHFVSTKRWTICCQVDMM